MTHVATSLADVLPAEALSDGAVLEPSLGRAPDAVAHPASSEEVATVVEWAAVQGVGVLPLASGLRLRTARLERPFVALRTDRLRGIEIYESADLTLTARAGTPMSELGARLGANRQWLPFDPPRVGERSLGGLVASGESGPVWMGYGDLRNHVLGATVVMGDGRTVRLGGRVVKNVAGFDLLKPVVGSRGRLAVITSVCVRAFPVPAEDRLLVLRAGTLAELADAGRSIGTAPVLPASSVLLAPARSIEAGAALLVRLHGATPTVDADQRTLERHCGVAFERPHDPAALLTEARDAAAGGPIEVVVSVLPSRVPEALAAVSNALGTPGDGLELVADTYLGRLRAAAHAVEAEAATKLRATVGRLGGSLSVRRFVAPAAGEDGGVDGDSRGGTPSRSREEADLIVGLERVFDPNGVFWPCRA